MTQTTYIVTPAHQVLSTDLTLLHNPPYYPVVDSSTFEPTGDLAEALDNDTRLLGMDAVKAYLSNTPLRNLVQNLERHHINVNLVEHEAVVITTLDFRKLTSLEDLETPYEFQVSDDHGPITSIEGDETETTYEIYDDLNGFQLATLTYAEELEPYLTELSVVLTAFDQLAQAGYQLHQTFETNAGPIGQEQQVCDLYLYPTNANLYGNRIVGADKLKPIGNTKPLFPMTTQSRCAWSTLGVQVTYKLTDPDHFVFETTSLEDFCNYVIDIINQLAID